MADILAAARESRRSGLEAIRDRLAADLEVCEADRSAQIAKQLAETLRELDSLAEPKGSAVDDLANPRAARRSAGASGS